MTDTPSDPTELRLSSLELIMLELFFRSDEEIVGRARRSVEAGPGGLDQAGRSTRLFTEDPTDASDQAPVAGMGEVERRMMILQTALLELIDGADPQLLDQASASLRGSLDAAMEDAERTARRGVLQLIEDARRRLAPAEKAVRKRKPKPKAKRGPRPAPRRTSAR